jgi:hypothetical protein
MKLIKSLEDGHAELKPCLAALDALESFLVRRAIVGIEPTGLLAMFRTAWATMDGKPSWEAFEDALKRRGTIEWPDDERVRASVLSRKIYKVGIRNYLLTEYDRSLGADVPTDKPWVEHVLPQSMTSDWEKTSSGLPLFSKEQHEHLVDTWGNLVCLSDSMNMEVAQSTYPVKRKFFAESSMYGSARVLARDYEAWTPETILERSAAIGEWVVQRWKR